MSIVNVSYSGSIASVGNPNTGVQVGDTIVGTATYDSSQTGSSGHYNFTGSAKAHTFAFKVFRAGVQIFSDSFAGLSTSTYTIDIRFNVLVGGVLGTTFELKGPCSSGQESLDLTLFDAGNVGQTAADLLPASANIGSFAFSLAGV